MVVGSIFYGGPIELFLIPAWCNKGHGMCYPVSGMVHIKKTLLLIGVVHVAAAGLLSRYLNRPLPYVRRHITKQNVWSVSLNKTFLLPSFMCYGLPY